MVRRVLWVALALQALAILLIRQPWITTDSRVYLELAARIDAHYARLSQVFLVADAVRPPAFPWLLWLFRDVLQLGNAAIVVMQMGLYLLSVYLIARVARRYTDDRIFLLACLLFPYAAFYAAVLMTEPWAIAACALAFYLAHQQLHAGKSIALGAVAGLAVLLRSNLIVLPVIVVLVALLGIGGAAGASVRSRLQNAALVALSAGLVLLPFTIRNAQSYDHWLPLQPAGALGASLFQGVWQREVPEADRSRFFRNRVITERARRSGYAAEMFRLTDELDVPRFTPLAIEELPAEKRIEADSLLMAAALRRIQQRPASYLRHVALNIYDLGNPRSYPAVTPRLVELLMRVVCVIIWFAGLGAIFLVRDRTKRGALMLSSAFVGGILFVQVWLHTEARYAAPVLLLVVFNAALLAGTALSRREPARP